MSTVSRDVLMAAYFTAPAEGDNALVPVRTRLVAREGGRATCVCESRDITKF